MNVSISNTNEHVEILFLWSPMTRNKGFLEFVVPGFQQLI